MGIIVDSREPGKYKRLFIAKGLDHEVKQLITGDVIVFNDAEPEVQIIIERKRLDDLISSYYSGRIAEQFERMSEEKFAILLVTGNLQDTLRKMPNKISNRVMPQILEEVMSMAIIQYNFRSVVWMIDGITNVHESGYITLVKCCQKIVQGQMDAIPQKKVLLSKDLRINTLRAMFGLDSGSAKNLLKKYGTVRKVISLTDAELMKVKGLGPAKVKTIRYILDESINKGNFEEKTTNKKCDKCGQDMTLVKMVGGNTYICKPCTFSKLK